MISANLKWSEQRIFRMIPGLEKVEFVRFGNASKYIFRISQTPLPTLQFLKRESLLAAGQITGTEGRGRSCRWLLAGINASTGDE